MATLAPPSPQKPNAPSAPRRIGLALQGGGSHGAFTWGVLDRLLEDERLEIAAVSGTSAGAMNAAALAAGHAQGGRQGARRALDKFWHSTAQQALLSPFQRTPLDRLLGRWNRVQCFALTGTYRSQKKACGKARLAANAERPWQEAQRRREPFSGFPQGEPPRGHLLCCVALTWGHHACGHAPRSWPLGDSL